MSLNFNLVNSNDPAEFLNGNATATDGTQVKDWRMKYFIHVTADSIAARKKRARDTSDITLVDFTGRGIPQGLTKEFNDSGAVVGQQYNDHVAQFVLTLSQLKDRKNTFPAVANVIENRLNNALSQIQGVNTKEAQVTRVVLQLLLKDEGSSAANTNAFFAAVTAPTSAAAVAPYYDVTVRAVGFPIDTIKWRYSTLKNAAASVVQNESLDFGSLFNSSPAKSVGNLGFEFVNDANGRLVKKYSDGRPVEMYDLNDQIKNSRTIQTATCNSMGLNTPADCNQFFAKCQKDTMDDCNTFMAGLNLNVIKNIKYVDPLHVNWVVKKFDWPTYLKSGVRHLKHTNQWLNPNNYNDKTEADLMKKIRSNTNLVAFFDAVKATTDAFPAILNPNFTGTGVANPFATQVAKSKAGKFGLKALMNQNPLSLSEFKAAFLKAQNMTNNNMTTLAANLGIRVLLPAPFAYGIQVGAGDSIVPNGQVQAYLNKLDDGTGFVPSSEATQNLWTNLMNNLRNRYSMDVSAIDTDVTNYLANLKDYEGRVHKAIAYVKVFTDNLVADEANGNQNVPYRLNRDVLDELTTVRDKLVTKTFNKSNTFFKNLFELLDRLERKIDGRN